MECRLSALNQFEVQVFTFESVLSACCQLGITLECMLSTLNQFGVQCVNFGSLWRAGCQL